MYGGKRPAGFNKGYFYEPTIIDNVKDNFTVMTEEPFGPITPITTFKTFEYQLRTCTVHLIEKNLIVGEEYQINEEI